MCCPVVRDVLEEEVWMFFSSMKQHIVGTTYYTEDWQLVLCLIFDFFFSEPENACDGWAVFDPEHILDLSHTRSVTLGMTKLVQSIHHFGPN